MTQTQFIEQEVKNYIKFLFPELNEEQLDNKFEETDYFFNEEENRIILKIKGLQPIAMGWSGKNGIYGLEDEDRYFDEKFQEGDNE